MGADHRLKLPAEKLPGELQPDLVRQFRGNLPGGKTLHQMKALHPFFLMPHFFDLAHILKGSITGTADGGLKQILLGFLLVEGFSNFTLQRFLISPAGTLFLIEGIIDGVIEAVDGNHTGICHRVAPGRNSRPWFRKNNRLVAREPFLFLTNCS